MGSNAFRTDLDQRCGSDRLKLFEIFHDLNMLSSYSQTRAGLGPPLGRTALGVERTGYDNVPPLLECVTSRR